jgi:hypothetical protein
MSTKLSCYSTITKYDSSVPINHYMDPTVTVGIPSVFLNVGRLPSVINEISEERLREVKYNSNRYLTNAQAYGEGPQ